MASFNRLDNSTEQFYEACSGLFLRGEAIPENLSESHKFVWLQPTIEADKEYLYVLCVGNIGKILALGGVENFCYELEAFNIPVGWSSGDVELYISWQDLYEDFLI